MLKPEKADAFVLLRVDHHDRAYSWAESKVFQIHPETGGLQVVHVAPSGEEAAKQPVQAKPSGLFAALSDQQLLQLGVPELLFPAVRSVQNEEDLDRMACPLPQEVYEALFFLACGYSFEGVLREMERTRALQPLDPNDYGKALEDPDSLRRFYVVENELELAAILSAPLEKWRVFLHPSQRRLVERNWNGPVRVLGGAGTGKTVAAVHRAKWLAERVFKGERDRILFTTFTRNLAPDIRENLGKICSQEVMSRIEVANLDKWVNEFLRRHGYPHDIDYGKRSIPLWKRALSLAPESSGLEDSFYREEWEKVIQPQGITALEQYMTASRVGRGVRLNRPLRKAIWPVFEEYRILLNEHGIVETYRIHRTEPEDRKAVGLRLATMHRVKGLKFDRMIIAWVNDGIIPHPGEITSDPVVRKESETRERALLYVAATRARKEVLVTGFGRPSRYV